MDPIMLNPEPADAEAVWHVPAGRRPRLRPQHISLLVLLLIPMTLTATLGTITFSEADGTAIASFWPAVAFQICFSIWFGVYGVLAGTLGPMLGNGLIGQTPCLFIPANAVQCLVAALWFRHRKLDPRLRRGRDWLELFLVVIVAGNALGALAGVSETALRGLVSGELTASGLFTIEALGRLGHEYFTWLLGNCLPALLLVPALLKTGSPPFARSPFFCRKFLGGTDPMLARHRRHRFIDLPMIAKLMTLAWMAGVLPLSVVAALSVWNTMAEADYLSAQANRDSVLYIRDDVERHALMLQLYARKLQAPGVDDAARRQMLNDWPTVPETFDHLEIVDVDDALGDMPSAARKAFRSLGMTFHDRPAVQVEPGPDDTDLWGIVVLESMGNKALRGRAVWRGDQPMTGQWASMDAVLVFDLTGVEIYRDAPDVLSDWTPELRGPSGGTRIIRHGGGSWYVAQATIPMLKMRLYTLSSRKAGIAVVLADMPQHVGVLLSLAIFGSFIVGSHIAHQISGRALKMAESVRDSGGEPGKLHVSIEGHDELGYLGQTLNRMSEDTAEYVRELQETTAEKERLAAEMELARQVQLAILPERPPSVDGYELAGACHPAREVGGDFFDFFGVGDDRVALMIGDVVGKGLKAAMFVTETHGIAHAAALESRTPERILSIINAAIVSSRGESSDFVTLFCAVLDPKEHRLLYASAGHNPPLLIHEGETRELELGEVPLAILSDPGYSLHEVKLSPGDTVIMYTDGVTEAANADRDFFEAARLKKVARECAGRSPRDLVDCILRAVREFAADVPQSDDITLLVLRRTG